MNKNPLRIVLLITFVDLIGFGLIIPLQAVYSERLGASGLTFGLLVASYAAMQIVFNPILGRWSDRVGRRPVLLLSIAGSVGSHALLGVADLAHSLPLMFVARLLDGITGANIATAQACIADVTTEDNRAKGMGLFGAAFGVGFVLGPALAALLADVGYRVSGDAGSSWPAFGASAVCLAALALVWRKLPETRRPDSATAWHRATAIDPARSRSVRRLLALVFGLGFAFVQFEVTIGYLCRQQLKLTERGIGLVFAYFGVLMVIVQGGLVGRLVRRFGEARLVRTAPLVTATGFLILSLIASGSSMTVAWSALLTGGLIAALGNGLTTPSMYALVSRAAGEARHGAALGAVQSAVSLARALAPPIAGLLYDLGPAWPYRVGAALFVVCTFAAAALARPVMPSSGKTATTGAHSSEPSR